MKMSIPTRVLLVLLQVAIGWHFFYEGVWKFNNPSWSSKGYLKNAPGPLSQPTKRLQLATSAAKARASGSSTTGTPGPSASEK